MMPPALWIPGSALILMLGSALATANSVARADGLLLDVMSLRGVEEAEAAELLGQPEECGETYQGRKCRYGRSIEVTFIDDRADWFQIVADAETPFEPAAIRALGLQPAQPSIRNPFRMHWLGHQGLAVITIISSGHNVEVFQVQAYTP